MERGFGLQSGIENMAQYHPLIVAKQGLHGVTGGAELTIERAHRLGNVPGGKTSAILLAIAT
jgi:hypothetical protein